MKNEGLAQAMAHTLNTGVDINARRIFLVGHVNEDMAKHFLAAFQVLDNTEGPIFVTLNTPGGSVTHGYAMYDAMRTSRNAVIVDVFGKAMSIGMIILQGADYRRIAPQARMMVHQVSLDVSDGTFHAEDLATEAEEMDRLNAIICDTLVKHSKGKLWPEKIKEMSKKDTYISPDEMLQLGLGDEVLPIHKVVRLNNGQKQQTPSKKKKAKKGSK